MIGKHINGRYKLLEVIGDGGMAIVYKATDLILDRIVAVKLLRPEFSKDDEFIKRFRREAESATSLDHPNIVSIFDVGEDEDYHYIVMEYVEGKTLKQSIRDRGALPIVEAIDIIKQIASAIEHAHENQIIHRDIKPHNILINEYGEAKVTDFGIAMAMTSATITHTNSVLGSVHYFSPEQARGGAATERSDIYSLGVVLYEVVTGVLPFSGDSPVSVALKHLQDRFPKPSLINTSLPKNVEQIILKAMAKEPHQRYENAQELYDALDNALDPTKVYDAPVVSDDDEATKVLSPVVPTDASESKPEKAEVETESDKEKQDKPPKNKKKKKAGKIVTIVFLILLLLGGAGALAFIFMPDLFYVPDVEVPDVSGMTYEDARTALIESNLAVVKEEQFNESIEEDDVISQDPSSGSMVKENSKVTLYVSKGAEKTELPNFIGKTQSEVEADLDSKGFENVKFEGEYRDEPKGEIYDQSPEAGKMVLPTEDRIVIWYSQGPEPVLLPDLTNKTKEEVEAFANDEGLKVAYNEAAFSDSVKEGLVMDQSPNTATRIDKGQTVTVTLSKGPEPEPEPEPEEERIVFTEEVKVDVKDKEKHTIEIIYRDSKTENGEIVEEVDKSSKFEFELTIDPGDYASYKVFDNGEEIESKTITYDQAKQKYGKNE
ncbi:Stk1 family PASTA domain-containing Ser/Thr kinase [Alkalihalobacillus sp. CinArs1]|uniref:Stk1 family PASTA domain-containing Ser/Thr kinase n=1 Tax=Alkalihalobacillus sp. CinArs1 TaxID=2995314 RepID=UPI0022DE94AA|nr:Stk1 family PASTA domain-containing Ser/Thr kinase [Alkalihalobacillus sp. CinArs1]